MAMRYIIDSQILRSVTRLGHLHGWLGTTYVCVPVKGL